MSDLTGLLNISVAFACIILSLLGILQSAFSTKVDKHTVRHFILFFVILLVYSTANLAAQLLQGQTGQTLRILLNMASYFEHCSLSLLAYTVSHYLLSIVDRRHSWKLLRVGMVVMVFLHLLFITLSQYSGMIYRVDAYNRITPGTLYPLAYLMNALMLFIDLVLLVRCRTLLTRGERIAFVIYLTVPSVAIAGRLFFARGSFITVSSMVITALVMFVFTIADQTDRYYREQQLNTRLKVDIMLGQIQPHFLYNALLVIQQICRVDPEKSASAIGDFAKYLRHNMDSITETAPIPFETELNHTKQYVKLQQLRFEDDLDIRYEITCSGFHIPTLTLQPLVENAIRYGIRKSEDGRGTVTVRTRETETAFEIDVIDDGPGFVPDSVLGDKQNASMGLRNVAERLRMTCGGELRIDSRIGHGTTATIVLPKKEAKYADLRA